METNLKPDVVALSELALTRWGKQFALTSSHRKWWERVSQDSEYCTSKQVEEDFNLACKEDGKALESFPPDSALMISNMISCIDKIAKILITFHKKETRLSPNFSKGKSWLEYAVLSYFNSVDTIIQLQTEVIQYYHHHQRQTREETEIPKFVS